MLNNQRAVQRALAAMLAVWLLAACATSTAPDYRPRLAGGTVGYNDWQLSPNRYRVSFSGSRASTRDDVEKNLLRRAAEVTLASGYTHFVLSLRNPERHWYWNYANWNGRWHSTTNFAYDDIMMLTPEEARRFSTAIEALTILQRLQLTVPVASTTSPLS
jgi:hypothetical protein